MADHYVQGSVAFICTVLEAALIEEAWQHAADLDNDLAPGDTSAEFLTAFPPVELGNPFNGLLAIFDDPRFPRFGAELQGTGADPCRVSIYVDSDFQPDAIAALIQCCCRQTLGEALIGFTWSYGSSRPRPENTGGEWCAIFADRIEFGEIAEGFRRRCSPLPIPGAMTGSIPRPTGEPKLPITRSASAISTGPPHGKARAMRQPKSDRLVVRMT